MSDIRVLPNIPVTQACRGMKKNTRIMRQFARQFFQWHFRDGYTIQKLTENFNKLFELLKCLFDLHISIRLMLPLVTSLVRSYETLLIKADIA